MPGTTFLSQRVFNFRPYRYCHYGVITFLLVILSPLLAFSITDTAFLRDLPEEGIATYEDGCRGLVALLKLAPRDSTFEKVVEELKARDIIPEKWNLEPKTKLTWGRVSFMLCRALKIKGGVIMRLTGTTERYAYRELVDKKLMPMGNKAIYLSGVDLMAIFAKVEDYMRKYKIKWE
jgi:hypothetical protein